MTSVPPIKTKFYPESDGQPMAETDEHRDEMVRLIELLKDYYQGQQVYVSGNLLLYYEEGNPKKRVAPDVLVAKGLSPHKRRIYKTWVEGKVPDVVIELTSRKTRRKDTTDKPLLYARLGVQEYYLFDVDREYLDPPLQGYRLAGTAYERLEADPSGGLVSQQLGLRLVGGEGVLQLYRLDRGERLLSGAERADREREQAESQAARAAREAERADREAERADREASAREAAEAELARLRAELDRRRP